MATHSVLNNGYTLHNKPFSFVLKLIGSLEIGGCTFSVNGHIPFSNEPIKIIEIKFETGRDVAETLDF
jgi:hypothetical protein